MLFFVSSAASTPTQQEEDSRAASIVSINGTTFPISCKSRVGGYFLVIADRDGFHSRLDTVFNYVSHRQKLYAPVEGILPILRAGTTDSASADLDNFFDPAQPNAARIESGASAQ